MAKAIAIARTQFGAFQAVQEMLRVTVVCGCAFALIAAGPVLPFLSI